MLQKQDIPPPPQQQDSQQQLYSSQLSLQQQDQYPSQQEQYPSQQQYSPQHSPQQYPPQHAPQQQYPHQYSPQFSPQQQYPQQYSSQPTQQQYPEEPPLPPGPPPQQQYVPNSPSSMTLDDIDAKSDYTHRITQVDDADYNDDGKQKSAGTLFDNPIIRQIYINITLFVFCIFSVPLWFSSDIVGNDLKNAFILASFSIIIILIASIFGLILAFLAKVKAIVPANFVIYIVLSFYLFGAFFYFVAGCQYAQSFNNLGKSIDIDLSSFGGIVWTEMFYIAAICAVTGVDLWKQFLNTREYRIYTLVSLYVFCSLVLSFSYLVASGVGIASYHALVPVGVSFLIGFLIALVYLIFFIMAMNISSEFVMRSTLDRLQPIFDSAAAVLLFIMMMITGIAYWSGKRKDEWEYVYYFGFGLFVILISIIMTFDIKLWDFIQRCIYGNDDEDNIQSEQEEEQEMQQEVAT